MFRYFFFSIPHTTFSTLNEPLSNIREYGENNSISLTLHSTVARNSLTPENRSIHSRSPQCCAHCLWRTIPSSFSIQPTRITNTMSDSFASEPSSRAERRSFQKGRIVIFVFCVSSVAFFVGLFEQVLLFVCEYGDARA